MTEPLRNWAGNVTFAARAQHAPRSLDELQAMVRRAPAIRAAGSRHSFTSVADTDGELVSLRHLNRVLEIDSAARTVTVEGGATYRDIARHLDAAGFALANLASLPHITIAGACATGTHGSGNANPGLAAAVAALTLVGADGQLLTLRRGDADFPGAPVNLGALGIVARLTLDLVPRYEARQEVWLDLPFDALTENFDAISASAYSVSIFTRWLGDSVGQVWRKSLGHAPALERHFFGAHWTPHPVPLIPRPGDVASTELLGSNQPWYQRIGHYPVDADIPTGAEIQTEYYVARADAAAALTTLHGMQHRFAPLLQISEIRTVAADDLWLSGCYRRDSVAIHFAWHPDPAGIASVLPEIEAALAPFAPRPHWGKVFAMSPPAVHAAFPRLADFRALAGRLDPGGKFRNRFVETCLL